MQINANAVTRTLDIDLCNTCALKVLSQVLANCDVFCNVVSVALTCSRRIGEPARPVISVVIPRRNPVGLTSGPFTGLPSSIFLVPTTTVMWLVRLRMRPARP